MISVADCVSLIGVLMMALGLAAAAIVVFGMINAAKSLTNREFSTTSAFPGAEQIQSITGLIEAVLKGPSWFSMFFTGLAAAYVGHLMGH